MLRLRNALYSPILVFVLLCLSPLAAAGSDLQSTKILADDAGSFADALAAGMTLTSGTQMSTAYLSERGGAIEQTLPTTAPHISLKWNNSGAVDVAANDKTISFGSTDLDVDRWGWDKGSSGKGFYFGSFSVYGSVETDKHAENAIHGIDTFAQFHQGWSYYWDDTKSGMERSIHGFTVLGTETTSSAFIGRNSGTYAGYAVVDSKFRNDSSPDKFRTRGVFRAQANFETSEISGNLTDLQRKRKVGGIWTEYEPLGYPVKMANATIKSNRFSGDMVRSDGTDVGDFFGKFYGPNGEEIGISVRLDNDEQTGVGFFSARQAD